MLISYLDVHLRLLSHGDLAVGGETDAIPLFIIAVGEIAGAGPHGVGIIQFAMFQGIVQVEGKIVLEQTADAQQGEAGLLLLVEEDIAAVQEDGVADQEVLQGLEIDREVDGFLEETDGAYPDDPFQFVQDLYAIGGDEYAKGFDTQCGIDGDPDEAILLDMDKGIDLIIFTIASFIMYFHPGGEGLEIDPVLLQLVQGLADQADGVGLEVFGRRDHDGFGRSIPAAGNGHDLLDLLGRAASCHCSGQKDQEEECRKLAMDMFK